MLRPIGITLTTVGVVALAVSLWFRQASVEAAGELWPRAEKAMKERQAWAKAPYGVVDYGDDRRANNIRAYKDAAAAVTTWNVMAGLCAAALLAGVLLLLLRRLIRPRALPPVE